MRQPALTSTASFKALATHAFDAASWQMRDLFGADPERFKRMSVEGAGLFLDYSKNRLDGRTLALLVGLARERGVERQRDAMFAGEKINLTEDRAVLHTALRAPIDAPALVVDGQDVGADVHDVLKRVHVFSDAVRSGAWRGYTGKPITDVVNIGIGGSDLGPKMACLALRQYSLPTLTLHFVSNDSGITAEEQQFLDEATIQIPGPAGVAARKAGSQKLAKYRSRPLPGMTQAQVKEVSDYRECVGEWGNPLSSSADFIFCPYHRAIVEYGNQW